MEVDGEEGSDWKGGNEPVMYVVFEIGRYMAGGDGYLDGLGQGYK